MAILTLDLPRELEQQLTEEAEQEGLPLPEYVLLRLSKRRKQEMPKTSAELVAYWQREGFIGSRPDIEDAQAYARALRGRAQKRVRN